MVLPSSFCPSSRLSVFDYKNVSSDVQSLLLEALTGRSSHQRCSMSKVVLRNFTGFTGNTRARVSFLIKRFCDRCFPVDFVKFLRTPFLQNSSGRLLLCGLWIVFIFFALMTGYIYFYSTTAFQTSEKMYSSYLSGKCKFGKSAEV